MGSREPGLVDRSSSSAVVRSLLGRRTGLRRPRPPGIGAAVVPDNTVARRGRTGEWAQLRAGKVDGTCDGRRWGVGQANASPVDLGIRAVVRRRGWLVHSPDDRLEP